MLYQFKDKIAHRVDYSINVDSPNEKLITSLNEIYKNIVGSSISYVMKSFFEEFENQQYTGTITTKWHYDKIVFSFKNGLFHTNNKRHAAIHGNDLNVFIQNGKLRTRDFGPAVTRYDNGKTSEMLFCDEEIAYSVADLMLSTVYVKGSTTHVFSNIHDKIMNIKPKYGASWIKKPNHYYFGDTQLTNEIVNYMNENNLAYKEISKEDWPMIMFQCGIRMNKCLNNE